MRIFAQALNITYETAHGETSPGRLKFLQFCGIGSDLIPGIGLTLQSSQSQSTHLDQSRSDRYQSLMGNSGKVWDRHVELLWTILAWLGVSLSLRTNALFILHLNAIDRGLHSRLFMPCELHDEALDCRNEMDMVYGKGGRGMESRGHLMITDEGSW